MMKTIAVYPGTFDPFTYGHEDIVKRAAHLFDEVIVAIANSRSKRPLFTLEERTTMAQTILHDYPNITVQPFTGLLCDFMQSQQANIIIRGLRAVSDFEYEFQMAGMNRHLMPNVETLFLPPSDQFQFVSGTFVREIALLGGDVSAFVAPFIQQRLHEKAHATPSLTPVK